MTDESRERNDFFLSRRGSVADIAREVAEVLTERGYKVLVQDYDIPYGSSFVEAMHEAVKNSRDLLILLTHDYETSPYTRKEFTSFEAERAQSLEKRRIVVLRCQDTPLRGLLADNVYQDLVGITDPEERRRRIIAAAEGQTPAHRPPPRPFIGVPPRNLDFSARGDELDRLDDILLSGKRAAVSELGAPPLSTQIGRAALSGMGGVGKTTLAAEYSYRYRTFYSGVCWCRGESRSSLVSSLLELALAIGLPRVDDLIGGAQKQEASAQATLRKLAEMRGHWLLIYDNVTSPDDIANLFPAAGAEVLITSRFANWSGWAEELTIDALPLNEATFYLERRANRSDPAGATLLAKDLGCLPLALEQAAALCKAGGVSFEQYRTHMPDLIRMKPRGARYPNSVFATISLAYDTARAECPDADRLMHLLAFLAPENLTVEMIGPSVMEVSERVAATEELTNLSIIALKGGSQIRIHRLTQEVIRQRFYESMNFATIRPMLHETLRHTFAMTRPNLLSPMWDHLLWSVHYDLDPKAAVDISYYHDDNQDVEINLECRKTGSDDAEIEAQVLVHPTQAHWKIYRYRLAGEWKLLNPVTRGHS